MPSSCHGCFGISFSCWPPGALLASVFKGNFGTGRPYCLCHESLLASSALLFSPLNGEIRSGGDWERKRGEKQSISVQTVEGCSQNCSPYVRMCLGESSLSFSSVPALQALLQPANRFLNVCFLFMLFKMWHLESFWKERSQQFSGGLSFARTRQGEANTEPSRAQITATFSHTEQGSVMGCQELFIKFVSVLCKVDIQNKTWFTEKKKIGKFYGADVVCTDRNNSETPHGQKCSLLKTKAESKSIHFNVYTFLKKKPTHNPNLSLNLFICP